jgi:hypothetical protein
VKWKRNFVFNYPLFWTPRIDDLKMGVFSLRKNKSDTGSVSQFPVRAIPGYPCKIAGFSSCGEYARIVSRLPKYGQFPPRQMAINGLWTAPVSATYFRPSGTWKSRRNANMRLVFSDGFYPLPENKSKTRKERPVQIKKSITASFPFSSLARPLPWT